VVREAAKRGHAVRSYSRNPPSTTVEGVDYAVGSLLDPQYLAGAVEDVDVVFETMSPRGDMAGRLEGILDELITLCAGAGVRLGVLGGASSLLVAEGGPRLFDVSDPAPEVLPEIRTGLALLERLRSAPQSLDWFYVSPPERFGAWEPEKVTGQYRVSDDILLRDDTGDSYISAADLAVAVVDEVEQPRHHRQRFHVAH
jgi:putative NADH-flavin reductase